jgi:CubicO group peptidase (beta-lactamase class C family)
MPRLAAVVALALAAALQPPASRPLPPLGDAPVVAGEAGRRLDEHLSRLAPFGFSGAVLVARGGAPVLAKGYGLADRARGAPLTARSIVPLGSVVKAFTAAAVLALEADGRLRVEDSLARFLPDLPADKRAITLHQMLTHASGLPLYAAAGDDEPLSREAFMRGWRDAPLAFPPGTGRSYSNVAYGVLAAIVEDVSGRDLEAFVRERFLLPAGMRETGWHYPRWDTTRVARTYGGAPDGPGRTQLRLPHAEGARATWAVHGAGGWLSTPEDLHRWHAALAGDALLPAAQRAKLHRAHAGTADRGAGYQWLFAPSPLGGRAMMAAGGDGAFETVLVRHLDADVVIVVSNNAGGQLAVPAAADLARILAGAAPEARPPAVVALPAAARARHAGAYALPAGGTIAAMPTDAGLALAPDGEGAYAALFGAPGAASALAGRTDSIVRASVAGDWGPLRAAFSLDAPAEVVGRRHAADRARAAEGLGAPNGWRVAGVIPAPGGGDVVVRFDHAGGAYYERYGWRGGEVALFRRERAPPALALLPTAADAFASYDVARGSLVTARFAGGRLRLASPAGGAVEAVPLGR